MLRTTLIPILLVATTFGGTAAAQDVIAIRDARVMVGPGKVLPRATVIVEDGRIKAVGSGLRVPDGAREIQARGKVVAPAFIDARNAALLDPGTAAASGSRAEAWAVWALRACEPRFARELLEAGVALSYQGLPLDPAKAGTGALVASDPTAADPSEAAWRRVGGVEFRLGGSATRGRREPQRPPSRRAPQGDGGEPLRIVPHGDHLHVLRADDPGPVACPQGDPLATGSGVPEEVSGLRLEVSGDVFHLFLDEDGAEPEPGAVDADPHHHDHDGARAVIHGRVPEAPGTQVLVTRRHAFTVDGSTAGALVCPHCLLDHGPGPGDLSPEPARPLAPDYAPEPPRPQRSDVRTRARTLKGLQGAIAGAKRYRKSWKKYEKAFEEYRKKLAEWKKSGGTSEPDAKKGEEGGKDAGKGDAPRKLSREELRKLPFRERIRYLRKMRRAARSGGTKASKGKSSGRPQPPKKPLRDPADEAMLKVVDRKAPLRVEAHWKQDILEAIGLAKEEGVQLVLVGATEAWKVLDEIEAAGAMVVLGPPLRLGWPGLDRIDARSTLAAELAEAGIPFAFMTAGAEGYRHDSLPLVAALWVAAGLPEETALEALTADAARVLGVGHEVGTVEPGRRALLQVLSGPPLEPDTRVELVVIDDKVIDL